MRIFLFLFFIISSIYASGDAVNYDVFGYTSLHRMCLGGQFEAAKKSIETDSPLLNLPDKTTKTLPLHILIEKVASNPKSADKIIKMIEMLVDKGSSLTAQTDSGWTPLNKAVYLASDFADYPLKVIDILLNKPTSCDAVKLTTRSQTALHFAAASRLHGNRAKEIVDKLINACDKSFNYGALNLQSWTALKVATSTGNFDVVDALKNRTPVSSNYWLYGIVAVVALVLLTASVLVYYIVFYKKDDESEERSEKAEETSEKAEEKCGEAEEKSNESVDSEVVASLETDSHESPLISSNLKKED